MENNSFQQPDQHEPTNQAFQQPEQSFQQSYGPPMGTNPNYEPLSFGQWLLTIFLCNLPCVGTILLLVWSFSDGNIHRKTFCRAYLLLSVIFVVLGIILYFAGVLSLMSMFGSFSEMNL